MLPSLRLGLHESMHHFRQSRATLTLIRNMQGKALKPRGCSTQESRSAAEQSLNLSGGTGCRIRQPDHWVARCGELVLGSCMTVLVLVDGRRRCHQLVPLIQGMVAQDSRVTEPTWHGHSRWKAVPRWEMVFVSWTRAATSNKTLGDHW